MNKEREKRPVQDLRRRAELLLPIEAREETKTFSEQDKDTIIHELRVHQVELEIQNEELRRAQQELAASRDAYLHLYNQSPVGYLTLNQFGIIQRHNDTVLELIDDAYADLRDRPFSSLLTDETRDQFLARFRPFFSDPNGKNLEVQLLARGRRGVSVRDVRLTGRSTPCGTDGKSHDLLLAITDITQQKQSERRIKALLGEKELLMQEIHHRVKNNLNTVMSMLNLQTAHAPDPAARKAIQAAAGRVRTMHAIYELLQDTDDYREIDLREYLTVLLGRITEGDELPLVVQRLASVRVTTRQAVSLGIILNELVVDAFKHAFPATRTREGADGKAERIVVSLETVGLERIALTVEDNGVGMNVEAMKRIAREDTASSGGFGLLLVRSQVDQLGGTFVVEPADPGTRFVITLPRERTRT